MGHQVTGLNFIEIGGGQALNMAEKPVSQTLFYYPGGSQKASTPDIPEDTYANGDRDNIKGIHQQLPAFNLERGQVIDDPLDNTRDNQLKDINRDQAQQPDQDPEAIFDEIGFD